MSLQDEIERYLMGATNLSRNQLRARLNDVIAPVKPHSPEDSPESHGMLGSQRDMAFRVTKQEFPSTAIRQTTQPQTSVPSAPGNAGGTIEDVVLVFGATAYYPCTLPGEIGPSI
jgi:hypothetical protein